MIRSLVVACLLAACGPAQSPGRAPAIDVVPSLNEDFAPGACVDAVYRDGDGTFVAVGAELRALQDGWLAPTAHRPSPASRLVARVDSIVTTSARDDAAFELRDEDARSLGRHVVALPPGTASCTPADPAARWWDADRVIVEVELACAGARACAVAAVRTPKDLPVLVR